MSTAFCVHDQACLQVLAACIQEDGEGIFALVRHLAQHRAEIDTEYVRKLVYRHWHYRAANWRFCACSTSAAAARWAWEMYWSGVQTWLHDAGVVCTQPYISLSIAPMQRRPARGGPGLPRLPLLFGPARTGGAPLGVLGILSLVIGHLTAILALERSIADLVAWRHLPFILDGVSLFVALLCLWPLATRLWDGLRNGIERDTLRPPARWACALFGVWTCVSLAQMAGIIPAPAEPTSMDALLAFASCIGALTWIHALLA